MPRALGLVTAVFTWGAAAAFANPTGPAVVSGSASILPTGTVLQINNTPNTIINWQSFSINVGELTRFTQQSAASAVLNRVITQNPSAILGALESNGRVFIVNPNGILFGAGSRIDVAGLVASALNLSDADFLAGRLRFAGGAGVVFQGGNISTPSGGQVYLVGATVVNTGLITAPGGEVVLAAGEAVELVNPATPNLRVEVTAANHQVVNLGQIAANAGRIGIFAGLIDHIGALSADTAVLTEDGRIVLRATNDIRFAPSSTISATGAGTGDIQIQSLAGSVALNGAGILADAQRGTVGVAGLTQESTAPLSTGVTTFGATSLGLVSAGETAGFSGTGVTATPVIQEGVTFNSTVPTLITGVPTLSTSVPTLITGVPTLTSSVPTTPTTTLNQAAPTTFAPGSTATFSTTSGSTFFSAPLEATAPR